MNLLTTSLLHAKAMARLMQWFLLWIECHWLLFFYNGRCSFCFTCHCRCAIVSLCTTIFYINLCVFSISKMWQTIILPVGLPSMWVAEMKTSSIVSSSLRVFRYRMQRSKIYLFTNLSVTSSAITK